MTKVLSVVTIFLLFVSLADGGMARPQLPARGVIPDEGTAVKVAEAVFLPIFGQEEVTKFQPYHAQLKDDIWTVYGTLKPSSRGGTPQLRIQKKDGKVLEIWHSQ